MKYVRHVLSILAVAVPMFALMYLFVMAIDTSDPVYALIGGLFGTATLIIGTFAWVGWELGLIRR